MEKAIEKKRAAASVDLTQGPLFKRVMLYTLPIILTGVLQLLFNTADLVVVGNSSDQAALPAVGATGSLVNLIINLLIGMSVGAGVVAANCYGSKDDKGMSELVHTAVPTALIGGVIFGLIGFFFAKPCLALMDTPDTIIDKAAIYVKIYSIGIPFSILYNFGAAILRSVGDTTRPLIFLVISGAVNVVFNLCFVFLFGMDVDGVATATVISQFISAVMVLVYLMRVKESHRFEWRKMKINGGKLVKMMLIGLPAGVQGALFSVSNVIIQKSINGFGDVVITGNTSSSNIEGYVYTCMNAFHQTALNFTGQHMGAKKYKRIKSIAALCLALVTGVGVVVGTAVYLLGRPLLSLYSPGRTEVIEYGMERLKIICLTYFLCGVLEVLSGVIRGMGYSISSMVITLAFICGYRLIWIYTVFVIPAYHTLLVLYYSYPISWILCTVFLAGLFIFAYSRTMKKAKRENVETAGCPEEGSKAETA